MDQAYHNEARCLADAKEQASQGSFSTFVLDGSIGMSVKLPARYLVRFLREMPLGRSDRLILPIQISQNATAFASFIEKATSERVRIEQSSFKRKAEFRVSVLRAYENCCAICGIALNLVEAAHILPFASTNSRDLVENGIALCVMHHRSYDNGLLTINAEFRVGVNDEVVKMLASRYLTQGLQQFRAALPTFLRLPSRESERPNREFIVLRDFYIRGTTCDLFDPS